MTFIEGKMIVHSSGCSPEIVIYCAFFDRGETPTRTHDVEARLIAKNNSR